MSPPGTLYVTMQPRAGLDKHQFHDWYNNEHGPTRLRIPQIFSNGLRYRATDGLTPSYLAAYDVVSMSLLDTDTYLTLRANRSCREADTIGQVEVTRYMYDLLYTKQKDAFVPTEELSNDQAEGLVTVAAKITTTDVDKAGEEYCKWFEEEHADMLAGVSGWLRSRLFRASALDGGKTTYLALHDYAKQNGLGGDAHKASMDNPRRTAIFEKYVAAKERRTYSLFYVFGPAPRDLQSLSHREDTMSTRFKSPDSTTSTTPGTGAVITSVISTPDSLSIPYRLEGNPSPYAPTVALGNSLLTSLHMWDPFVAILKKQRPDLRILRYDTRGRHAIPQPPVPATLDTVAEDLRTVLDALRITKLHSLIGVSMGGATTLQFAIKYPQRLSSFVACDFNATSSAANTQAWKDRISVAEADNNTGIATLAGQTVGRWFHPDTMANKAETVAWMTAMVAENNVQGFANSCTTLWEYDLKPGMGGCDVPGLFVVGESDGKGALVKAMDGFRGLLGNKGADLVVVPEAGHLPMCENPEGFWEAVKDFI